MTLRVLDLFSGIGGFSLGLERAGMRTVAFCEIDPYCRAVLKKHWPDVRCYEDVRALYGLHCGPVDVICGGFPCQPFSVAGKRMGNKDDRHLWPEYRRLVEELGPTWVIGENVVGLVEMGLDTVLDDLEALGYSARTFDIPACSVGARHYRRRIWIVAHRDPRFGFGSNGQIQAGRNATGSSGEVVADTKDNGQSWSRTTWPRRYGFTDIREDAYNASQWLSEPDVGRVADGVPSRVDRLRALGNAVVPQIPEIIGRAIIEAERLSAHP